MVVVHKPMASDGTSLDSRWTRLAVSRTIEAPIADVWAAVADHQQWLTWYRPLSKFELVEGDQLAIEAVVWEREGLWESTSEIVEWESGRLVGLATRALNLRWLLSKHYRRIELCSVGEAGSQTEVTITGGFAFGPLGWALVGYTYPQMIAAMYFEYRSALKGLGEMLDQAR